MPLLFPVAFSSASHHLVHVMTLMRSKLGINTTDGGGHGQQT